MEFFTDWFKRYFSNPEVIVLMAIILLVVGIFMTMGDILAPVFVSIVLAYLLQWLVAQLEKMKVPHFIAVTVIFLAFVSVLVISLLILLPLLWRQLTAFFHQLPDMMLQGQALLMHLPEKYPDYISADQIQSLLATIKTYVAKLGQIILSASLASIPGLIILSVYLVLVPLLIYFFLMDRAVILNWFVRYLPSRRQLVADIWYEVHEQIGNYVRGRVLEIILVSVVSYIVFSFMQLQYAILLAALVGISVIVPYLGAALVTVPVIIIAFLQWGLGAHFVYFVIAYSIILVLDANVLVPLLFAEAVQLHPIAIMLAILIFGGFWGFWGVFFAIPLASLVKAILDKWPKSISKN